MSPDKTCNDRLQSKHHCRYKICDTQNAQESSAQDALLSIKWPTSQSISLSDDMELEPTVNLEVLKSKKCKESEVELYMRKITGPDDKNEPAPRKPLGIFRLSDLGKLKINVKSQSVCGCRITFDKKSHLVAKTSKVKNVFFQIQELDENEAIENSGDQIIELPVAVCRKDQGKSNILPLTSCSNHDGQKKENELDEKVKSFPHGGTTLKCTCVQQVNDCKKLKNFCSSKSPSLKRSKTKSVIKCCISKSSDTLELYSSESTSLKRSKTKSVKRFLNIKSPTTFLNIKTPREKSVDRSCSRNSHNMKISKSKLVLKSYSSNGLKLKSPKRKSPTQNMRKNSENSRPVSVNNEKRKLKCTFKKRLNVHSPTNCLGLHSVGKSSEKVKIVLPDVMTECRFKTIVDSAEKSCKNSTTDNTKSKTLPYSTKFESCEKSCNNPTTDNPKSKTPQCSSKSESIECFESFKSIECSKSFESIKCSKRFNSKSIECSTQYKSAQSSTKSSSPICESKQADIKSTHTICEAKAVKCRKQKTSKSKTVENQPEKYVCNNCKTKALHSISKCTCSISQLKQVFNQSKINDTAAKTVKCPIQKTSKSKYVENKREKYICNSCKTKALHNLTNCISVSQNKKMRKNSENSFDIPVNAQKNKTKCTHKKRTIAHSPYLVAKCSEKVNIVLPEEKTQCRFWKNKDSGESRNIQMSTIKASIPIQLDELLKNSLSNLVNVVDIRKTGIHRLESRNKSPILSLLRLMDRTIRFSIENKRNRDKILTEVCKISCNNPTKDNPKLNTLQCSTKSESIECFERFESIECSKSFNSKSIECSMQSKSVQSSTKSSSSISESKPTDMKFSHTICEAKTVKCPNQKTSKSKTVENQPEKYDCNNCKTKGLHNLSNCTCSISQSKQAFNQLEINDTAAKTVKCSIQKTSKSKNVENQPEKYECNNCKTKGLHYLSNCTCSISQSKEAFNQTKMTDKSSHVDCLPMSSNITDVEILQSPINENTNAVCFHNSVEPALNKSKDDKCNKNIIGPPHKSILKISRGSCQDINERPSTYEFKSEMHNLKCENLKEIEGIRSNIGRNKINDISSQKFANNHEESLKTIFPLSDETYCEHYCKTSEKSNKRKCNTTTDKPCFKRSPRNKTKLNCKKNVIKKVSFSKRISRQRKCSNCGRAANQNVDKCLLDAKPFNRDKHVASCSDESFCEESCKSSEKSNEIKCNTTVDEPFLKRSPRKKTKFLCKKSVIKKDSFSKRTSRQRKCSNCGRAANQNADKCLLDAKPFNRDKHVASCSDESFCEESCKRREKSNKRKCNATADKPFSKRSHEKKTKFNCKESIIMKDSFSKRTSRQNKCSKCGRVTNQYAVKCLLGAKPFSEKKHVGFKGKCNIIEEKQHYNQFSTESIANTKVSEQNTNNVTSECQEKNREIASVVSKSSFKRQKRSIRTSPNCTCDWRDKTKIIGDGFNALVRIKNRKKSGNSNIEPEKCLEKRKSHASTILIKRPSKCICAHGSKNTNNQISECRKKNREDASVVSKSSLNKKKRSGRTSPNCLCEWREKTTIIGDGFNAHVRIENREKSGSSNIKPGIYLEAVGQPSSISIKRSSKCTCVHGSKSKTIGGKLEKFHLKLEDSCGKVEQWPPMILLNNPSRASRIRSISKSSTCQTKSNLKRSSCKKKQSRLENQNISRQSKSTCSISDRTGDEHKKQTGAENKKQESLVCTRNEDNIISKKKSVTQQFNIECLNKTEAQRPENKNYRVCTSMKVIPGTIIKGDNKIADSKQNKQGLSAYKTHHHHLQTNERGLSIARIHNPHFLSPIIIPGKRLNMVSLLKDNSMMQSKYSISELKKYFHVENNCHRHTKKNIESSKRQDYKRATVQNVGKPCNKKNCLKNKCEVKSRTTKSTVENYCYSSQKALSASKKHSKCDGSIVKDFKMVGDKKCPSFDKKMDGKIPFICKRQDKTSEPKEANDKIRCKSNLKYNTCEVNSKTNKSKVEKCCYSSLGATSASKIHEKCCDKIAKHFSLVSDKKCRKFDKEIHGINLFMCDRQNSSCFLIPRGERIEANEKNRCKTNIKNKTCEVNSRTHKPIVENCCYPLQGSKSASKVLEKRYDSIPKDFTIVSCKKRPKFDKTMNGKIPIMCCRQDPSSSSSSSSEISRDETLKPKQKNDEIRCKTNIKYKTCEGKSRKNIPIVEKCWYCSQRAKSESKIHKKCYDSIVKDVSMVSGKKHPKFEKEMDEKIPIMCSRQDSSSSSSCSVISRDITPEPKEANVLIASRIHRKRNDCIVIDLTMSDEKCPKFDKETDEKIPIMCNQQDSSSSSSCSVLSRDKSPEPKEANDKTRCKTNMKNKTCEGKSRTNIPTVEKCCYSSRGAKSASKIHEKCNDSIATDFSIVRGKKRPKLDKEMERKIPIMCSRQESSSSCSVLSRDKPPEPKKANEKSRYKNSIKYNNTCEGKSRTNIPILKNSCFSSQGAKSASKIHRKCNHSILKDFTMVSDSKCPKFDREIDGKFPSKCKRQNSSSVLSRDKTLEPKEANDKRKCKTNIKYKTCKGKSRTTKPIVEKSCYSSQGAKSESKIHRKCNDVKDFTIVIDKKCPNNDKEIDEKIPIVWNRQDSSCFVNSRDKTLEPIKANDKFRCKTNVKYKRQSQCEPCNYLDRENLKDIEEKPNIMCEIILRNEEHFSEDKRKICKRDEQKKQEKPFRVKDLKCEPRETPTLSDFLNELKNVHEKLVNRNSVGNAVSANNCPLERDENRAPSMVIDSDHLNDANCIKVSCPRETEEEITADQMPYCEGPKQNKISKENENEIKQVVCDIKKGQSDENKYKYITKELPVKSNKQGNCFEDIRYKKGKGCEQDKKDDAKCELGKELASAIKLVNLTGTCKVLKNKCSKRSSKTRKTSSKQKPRCLSLFDYNLNDTENPSCEARENITNTTVYTKPKSKGSGIKYMCKRSQSMEDFWKIGSVAKKKTEVGRNRKVNNDNDPVHSLDCPRKSTVSRKTSVFTSQLSHTEIYFSIQKPSQLHKGQRQTTQNSILEISNKVSKQFFGNIKSQADKLLGWFRNTTDSWTGDPETVETKAIKVEKKCENNGVNEQNYENNGVNEENYEKNEVHEIVTSANCELINKLKTNIKINEAFDQVYSELEKYFSDKQNLLDTVSHLATLNNLEDLLASSKTYSAGDVDLNIYPLYLREKSLYEMSQFEEKFEQFVSLSQQVTCYQTFNQKLTHQTSSLGSIPVCDRSLWSRKTMRCNQIFSNISEVDSDTLTRDKNSSFLHNSWKPNNVLVKNDD